MTEIELLSPARDAETGIAAITCGADAVYIGAAQFGAREAAANPLADIEQLVAYAHKYWARVYVTVNTLLHDHEIPLAERLIHQLYHIGVDAIIIQDLGLLECDLPPIPLFASTQMHNLTPQRVAFLEQVGIRRAILARELTLDQIRAIRAATTIELETFIHGALCVSYSGQCYLSYALGGRSGNRGQCAQPCRKPYTLLDANNQPIITGSHLLSLRDLNLTAHLPALLDAGVTSFKIEGRLKDKAYVMNVVAHYRQQLDKAMQSAASTRRAASTHRAASGTAAIDFTPDPAKTFNRGFTTYFLNGRDNGRDSGLTAWDTPKSLGEPLGKVKVVRNRTFTLDSDTPVNRGDGLCYFNANHELCGTTVNDVEGPLIFPDKLDGLTPGTLVYRNHDHAFLTALDKSRVERKMAVTFTLSLAPGGLTLTITDEDGVQANHTLPGNYPPAEKPEAARATLDKQLRKLGGTEYTCAGVELAFDNPPFVPVAAINALRRAALEALTAARAAHRPRMAGGITPNDAPYPVNTLTFEGNVLNQKAAAFYHRHGVTHIEPAAESGLDLTGRKVMTTRYCLRHALNACPKQPGALKLPEPLTLLDEQGHRLTLRFNCARCEMEVYYP